MYEYKLGTFDFNGANQVADKIIANSDPSPANDYYKASTFYLNKQYDQAITSANGIMQKMGDQTPPKVYKVLGYSYIDKGEAAKALPFVEKYFAKTDPEELSPQDYNLKAMAYAATPGKENEVLQAYMDGLKSDTSSVNKVKMLQEGAKFFGDKGNHEVQGDLLAEVLKIKSDPGIRDYFDAGYTGYYQGKNYEKSWQVFDAMRTKFPDVNYGYLWTFNNSRIFDSSYSKNVLIPDAEKLAAFSQKDTAKDAKANLFSASIALFPYYINVKSDKENGLKYLTLAHDNAPNDETKQQIQGFIDQVNKMNGKPAGGASGSAPKKDSTGTAPKDSSGTKPRA